MVPKGWSEITLGQLTTVITSGSRDWAQYYAETGSKFIRMTNLNRHGIHLLLDDMKFVNIKSNSSDGKRTSLNEGDILCSITAELGKIGWIPSNFGEAYINQHTALIRIDRKKADSKFIAYQLSSSKLNKTLNSLNDAGAKAGLNLSTIKSIPIHYPPLAEQQKIAQILSTWDQAIAVTETLLENSQQQKKALMQQLLTGKKRLLDENGVRFSGEWGKVHIQECAECLDNKRIPLNSEQRLKMIGDIPYWGANGIVDYVSHYIFDETIVLLAEDGGYFDEYQIRPIANISFGKSWVNNHSHVLKAKRNCTNEWIYYCLVHKNIMAFVNVGTRSKLNKSDMLMISIYLPSLEEQVVITKVFSIADQEIQALQQKLDFLKQEKKALMQQLLTGKRRVKVAA